MNKIPVTILIIFLLLGLGSPVLADDQFPLMTREEFDEWPKWPEYTVFNYFPSKGSNCTWYAHGRMMQLGYCKEALDSMRFNAHTWADHAARGAEVTDIPEAASIAFWDGNASFGGSLGHVAVVEAVEEDGSILVSDSSSSRSAYNTYTIEPDDRRWPTSFIVLPAAAEKSNVFVPGENVRTTAGSLNFRLEGADRSPVQLPEGAILEVKEHPSNGIYASQPGSIFSYHYWWYAAAEINDQVEYGWVAESYLETAESTGPLPEDDSGSDPLEETDPDHDPETESETKSDPDSNPDPGSDPESDSEVDSDSDPAANPEDEAWSGDESDSSKDDSDPDSDSDSDPVIIYGDINGNGEVDVQDVTLTMQHVLKIKEFDDGQLGAADVNGDSKVDVNDVVLIMQHALGLIGSFEVAGS